MITQCEVCKKEYYQRSSHFNRVKRHFCSNKCKGIGLSGKNNPAWKDSWEKVCLNCGKVFRHKDGKGKKFCSQGCMGQFKSKNQSKVIKCSYCGKEIKVILAKIKEGKSNYCSKECANKGHSVRMEGMGNTNWLEGIGKLPYKWTFNNKLKRKIRKRDGWKCRLCGKEEKEIIKKKGCGLAIHHIDYNKKNNNENNLISLCNRCHGLTHYNREKWKKELYNLLGK